MITGIEPVTLRRQPSILPLLLYHRFSAKSRLDRFFRGSILNLFFIKKNKFKILPLKTSILQAWKDNFSLLKNKKVIATTGNSKRGSIESVVAFLTTTNSIEVSYQIKNCSRRSLLLFCSLEKDCFSEWEKSMRICWSLKEWEIEEDLK